MTLLAPGYAVFAINPLQVARYRERHSPSGRSRMGICWPRSLAGSVHHRPIAGDSAVAGDRAVMHRSSERFGQQMRIRLRPDGDGAPDTGPPATG